MRKQNSAIDTPTTRGDGDFGVMSAFPHKKKHKSKYVFTNRNPDVKNVREECVDVYVTALSARFICARR